MCRFFIYLLMLLSFAIKAQEKNKTFRQQEWLQYYNQIQLSNKFFLLSDAGIRIQNNNPGLNQLLIRTGLSCNLKPNTSVTIGFGHFTSFHATNRIKTEYRPYQEILFKQALNAVKLQHRLRAEERTFHSEISGEINFNFRFRYRLYITYPIVKFNRERQSLFGIVSDEIFINCGKRIVYNFDQNRIIAGLGYSLNKNLQFTFNYVHQYAQKNSPIVYETTDILWIGVTHSIAKPANPN